MNKQPFVFPLAAATLAMSIVSTTALAADKAKPETITCEDFLVLDEAVQPGIVYWLNGKSGEVDAIDVDEYDTPVAYVITECQKEKGATVWQKVKQYIHKMKAYVEPTKPANSPAKP